MLEDDFLQIEEEKEEEATWLVTFADLTMLLLVFFILLFSMSNLNQETFKETLFSVKQALGQAKKGILSVTLGQEGPGVSVTEIKRYREMIEGQKRSFQTCSTFTQKKA